MFSRMFGKKADATPSPNAQIQKLGDTLEVIEKREEVLNKKIDQEVAKARYAVLGTGTDASLCLSSNPLSV